MGFYAAYPQSGTFEPSLQQGDIISPLPFVAFRIASTPLLAEQVDDIARLDVLDLSASAPEEGRIVVAYARKAAIIISQSCDIERAINPILVAPIRSFSSQFPDVTIGSKNFLTRINNLSNPGKNPTSFPLPPADCAGFSLPYSVVTFFEMQSILPEELGKISTLVKLRLSPDALGKFQERIAFLFGRFAAPDNFFLAEEHKG